MGSEPNTFDKAIALVLSARLIVLLALAGTCLGTVTLAFRETDPFLQNWLIEIFGATLLFLAVLGVDPGKSSARLVAGIATVGGALALGSVLARTYQPLAAILTEAAAAFILFVILEALLRRLLINAAEREVMLRIKIQDARRDVVAKAKALPASLLPEINTDKYEEALEFQVWGEAGPPGPQSVADEPKWEELWKASITPGSDSPSRHA